MLQFTAFGVPYVAFVPGPDSPSSSTSSFCHIDTPPPPPPPPPRFPSPSSLFKRKPTPAPPSSQAAPTPPPRSDAPETHGIHIQFPPGHGHSRLRRKERLVHLQQTIRTAVLDAGMSGSPGNTTAVHRTRGYKTADALFCGTYGQVMAALQGAGLSAGPCAGGAISGYTRLGALFVARGDGASGVQLRKMTLWG